MPSGSTRSYYLLVPAMLCLLTGEAAVRAQLSSKDAEVTKWAYLTPKRSPVPRVQNAGRVQNPIDAFIFAQLEANGLTLSRPADKLTLLRRVTFDLTGLP